MIKERKTLIKTEEKAMRNRTAKKNLMQIIPVLLVIAVFFLFAAAPVSAASKKMKVITDPNIKYYSNGLVKKIFDTPRIFLYKYDKAGRITSIQQYYKDEETGPDLYFQYKFKYNKKGTLKSAQEINYITPSWTIKTKYSFKLDKKKRIIKLHYGEDNEEVKATWKYDSKGRVKTYLSKDYSFLELDNSARYDVTRTSKGHIKKLKVKKMGEGAYTVKFSTKVKSGVAKTIVRKNPDGTKETKTYQYGKKKVPKKLRKVVKAQQIDLLYLGSDAIGAASPFFSLMLAD